MTVEQQLRRTLMDERFAMAAWPDPVQRISAGVARRRRHRSVALACAAALWWAETGASDQMAAGDHVIPWQSAPRTPADEPCAARAPSRRSGVPRR